MLLVVSFVKLWILLSVKFFKLLLIFRRVIYSYLTLMLLCREEMKQSGAYSCDVGDCSFFNAGKRRRSTESESP